MATPTIQQIIDQVKLTRALAALTASTGLEFAKWVQRSIYADGPHTQYTDHASPKTVLMVAGTKEYAQDVSIVMVGDVHYQPSATTSTHTVLQPTTIEALRQVESGWRLAANATPVYFYLISHSNAPYIGLHPTPAVSASGSYPRIAIWGAETIADVTLSSEIGNTVKNMDVYLFGISFRAAYQYAPEMAAHYYALYTQAKMENAQWLQTRSNLINGGEAVTARR